MKLRHQSMLKVKTKMKSRMFAASAAITVMLCSVPCGIADAQTRPVNGNDRNVSMETLDTSRGLSLKVTKAKGNPYNDHREGQLPEGRLAGVKFKLYIAPDFLIANDADRKKATRARTQEEWDAIKRELVATQVTDAKGEVTFTNLRPALYLLEEVAPDTAHNYHVSAPQWVVLPLADAEGSRFIYDNVMVVKPSPTVTTTPPATTTPPTRPPGTPPPTTPGTPPATTTTVTPPPGTPPATPPGTPPGTPGKPGWLPETGASVLGIVFAGLMLIGLGAFISRRNAN